MTRSADAGPSGGGAPAGLAFVRRPGGLVLISIAGQLLGFVVTLVAARVLDADNFAAYAVASALFIVLATFAPLGSEKHALRHLPAFLASASLSRARGLVGFGLARTLRVSVIAMVAVGLFAWNALPPGPRQQAIVATCLSLPAGALCHYGVEVLTAAGRPMFALLVFKVLVPTAALVFVGVGLLLSWPITGAFVVGAWGVGWLFSLLAIANGFRAAAPAGLWRAQGAREARRWRSEARPFLAYRLTMAVMAQGPLLMLGAVDGPAVDIGIFAAAASSASLVTVLATATNRAYGRELGLLIERNDRDGWARLGRERLRWIGPSVLAFIVLFAILAEPILSQFQPRFAQAGQWPLRILALANAITVILALAPTTLKYLGRAQTIYRILFAAVGLELLLLLLLVPALGASGAALSYLFAIGAMYGVFAAVANRAVGKGNPA